MIAAYRAGLVEEVRLRTAFQYPREKDYLSVPQADGYRALHVTFKIDGYWTEVQLKTHLSKSWEVYSHDLFYRSLPGDPKNDRLKERARTLAELYVSCERLGDEIIEDLSALHRQRGIDMLRRRSDA
jgi:ppGpp synthetase/RelA/SpoT-type nucleotidyltranferase